MGVRPLIVLYFAYIYAGLSSYDCFLLDMHSILNILNTLGNERSVS
jgi:hypothetical protein